MVGGGGGSCISLLLCAVRSGELQGGNRVKFVGESSWSSFVYARFFRLPLRQETVEEESLEVFLLGHWRSGGNVSIVCFVKLRRVNIACDIVALILSKVNCCCYWYRRLPL